MLVQGGTHLDFRSRDGMTPVHKAIRAHNHAGLMVRTCRSETYSSRTGDVDKIN